MKHNHFIYGISILGLAALILMLNIISPTEIGPLGVLLFFTTVYVVCFGVVTFILQAFLRIAFKKKTFRNKDYLYSAILSFGPIMLLMARSFGAISLWTVGLIFVFLTLSSFLVHKKV